MYHYSNERYESLKTRRAQGINENKGAGKDKEIGLYIDHISFFFEEIPIDILGTLYKNVKHPIWKTGNKIWQYEIEIETLPEFSYDIVESPEITKLYDDWWENEKLFTVEEFRKEKQRLKVSLGQIGAGRRNFVKAASPMLGLTRKAYIELISKPYFKENWDDNQQKYAPAVPHVMLYPEGGIVEYQSCKEVTVGNTRVPGLEDYKPLYNKW